jgi:glycosyltransferase involved in cell wall biosynthesis
VTPVNGQREVVGYPSQAVLQDRPLRLAYLADPNELAASEWMAFFADRGHDVSVLVRAQDDVSRLHPAIRPVPLTEFGGRTVRPLGYLDARRSTQEALARIRPDVLHAHYLTGWGWMARLSGFHPYVLTLWGSDMYRTLVRSRKARWFGRLALGSADLVTMESHDLARRAVAAGAAEGRTEVIQFGVDTSVYRPQPPDDELRARLGLSGRRVVFSPRQIAPLYDHLSIVRALATLPADVSLLLSAWRAQPGYLAELEALAASLGVGDRLTIVPKIDHAEMARHYGMAEAVVSVPETDSVSVSILEAMACGTPVVASDLPSPREWLDELSPELVVPFGDATALGTALRRVLDLTPAERADYATRARQLVQDRAERETNMCRMEMHYRRLAASRATA